MGAPKVRALCVFGTRPDAVKMAPVVRELLARRDRFDTYVAVTGQHREQLDQVLRAFDLHPDCDLGIMQHGQTLTDITTRALTGLDQVLSEWKPTVVLAQGDTTTTFVAALAAFYHRVPYGHVEAGLRTDNIYDPFPEEMNRRLAAVVASFHFAPTEGARANLLREGIPPGRIWVTGNTGIDALLAVASQPYEWPSGLLGDAVASRNRVVLVTAHRRENWGEPMRGICRAIGQLSDEHTDCVFVFAMHRNPVVRDTVQEMLGGRTRVLLIEPPDYVPFVKLMQRADIILTDSGGVQEEAPSLGVPVLVLRKTTERPEGVEAGSARLVGTDPIDIVAACRALLGSSDPTCGTICAANPYGDGLAASRIVDVLAEALKA